MKNSNKQNNSKSKRASRKSLVAVAVAVAVLAVGVVTALSRQSAPAQKAQAEERKPQVAKQSSKNYVTSNAAGQIVVLNRQTGQTRPLTPEEAARLAEGIKQLVNQSTEGLVQVHRADGSVSMDLQGRFQNVMLAKKEDDGTISQSCVDNLESAAAFFEIDPALLGIATPVSKTPTSHKLEDR
jgi:type II secretory pathway pseudopilin PulG